MKVHTTIQGERNATDSTQEFYAGRSRFGSRTGIVEGELEDRIAHGKRDKPAIHTVSDEEAPKRLAHAATVIEEMKRKWQLDQHIHVAVVYEAGQDAFWIGRALVDLGYEALAIDPASIPVERHARRAKTDRLDAIKLVTCLRAWLRGERDRMHVIRAPSPQAEAQRHLVRDRGEMQKECGQGRKTYSVGRIAMRRMF